ncbi:MAG: four helix bundle protein [Flavobacteriales bacterium]|nr:four helix bundle protein [Flavobacteriales bacterium]
MRDLTKLEMWQLGMDIAVEVTEILESIPTTKAGFKIRDQADDAACSIPSNIAEGSSRRSEKEKYRYYEYALGSAFELQTRMLIFQPGICNRISTTAQKRCGINRFAGFPFVNVA